MDEKYRIDTDENRLFLMEMRQKLLAFAVHFPAPDGTAYYLHDDGTPWPEKNRETYETARMAHCYSIASFLEYPEAGKLADEALRGLAGALADEKNGGWYAGIRPDGSPMEGKLCYAHAFVLLAASSGLLAGRDGAQQLLSRAERIYDEKFWDNATGLARDGWNTEFTQCDRYRGLNANMHSVEALLAVADATGNSDYRVRAGRIIEHVIGWALDYDWRIPEHYTEDWKPDTEYNAQHREDPFKPYGATPGHGMEWARLITQWALSTYPTMQGLRRPYTDAAESLYRRALKDGWNADGAEGFVYTTDWEGKPVVHERMHWVLAEAINTSAVLYRVTRKNQYAKDYAMFMQYLDRSVFDHESGSWHHELDRNNQVSGKVWPGKPDLYHALQATLIPCMNPDVSIAKAVKDEVEQLKNPVDTPLLHEYNI